MAPDEKPSLLTSVFAAVACLGAFPVGFMLFAITEHSVADAWNEGGSWMYVISLATLVSSFVNAVGVFLVARGAPAVLGVGLFTSIGVGFLGALGFRAGMSDSFAAVAFASPLDRSLIMYGATGEASMCLVLAGMFVSALFLFTGVGSLIASAGTRSLRRPLASFALGAVALGIWQFFSGRVVASEADAYRAVAHADPYDFAVLLFSFLDDAQQARAQATGALVVVVLCVLLAAALLKRSPRALAAVVGGLLVSAAGLGAQRVLAKPGSDELALLSQANVERPLRELDGSPLDRRDRFVFLGAELRDESGEVIPRLDEEALARLSSDDQVIVRLERDASAERLFETLARLSALKVRSVVLAGSQRLEVPPGVKVPPPFDQQLVAVRGVRVLLADERGCATGKCEFGTLADDGLHVGGEVWPLVNRSSASSYGQPEAEDAVHVVVGALTLEQLLSLAHTGVAKGRPIALHFSAEE